MCSTPPGLGFVIALLPRGFGAIDIEPFQGWGINHSFQNSEMKVLVEFILNLVLS